MNFIRKDGLSVSMHVRVGVCIHARGKECKGAYNLGGEGEADQKTN